MTCDCLDLDCLTCNPFSHMSVGPLIQALRELHDTACENERDHPAYANATWDAIDRIKRAVYISDDDLWPEPEGGICGHEAPAVVAGPPLLCHLRAGHGGWHEAPQHDSHGSPLDAARWGVRTQGPES